MLTYIFDFVNAVVKAYQYTSLTSVMLLDCWAIPCVILLTWLFLKTKYGLRKFIGVGICIAGIVLGIFSDVHASARASKNMLHYCYM
jgi:solute carrier family 35, member F1/2